MQVITNEEFVASKARIGKIGTLVGLAALIAGFFTSLNIQLILISYVFLIVGILAFNVGRYHSLRWGTRPRPDEILANSLKGLDHKHVLLNYVPGMPVSHILLSPLGLFVIEPRIHDGEITCEGDKCKRMRSLGTMIRSFVEGNLGSPTKDAQQAIAGMKSFLAEKLGSDTAEAVPIEAVIVFTNPLVQLTATNPTVPTIVPKDLKGQVRSLQGRTKMGGDLYRRLNEVFQANDIKPRIPESTSRDRRRKKASI